jgi:hypothetical protein
MGNTRYSISGIEYKVTIRIGMSWWQRVMECRCVPMSCWIDGHRSNDQNLNPGNWMYSTMLQSRHFIQPYPSTITKIQREQVSPDNPVDVFKSEVEFPMLGGSDTPEH